VGDLNTSPWSAHFQDLLHHTVLRDSQRGFGLQGTWPQFYSPLGNDTLLSRLGGLLGLAQIPIDHVLISPEWQVGHWKRLDPVGSDHWPIEVDLRLKH